MDASQFDRFTTSLPRRSLTGGLLALALGVSAVEAKKKKKPCPPCLGRKKGKCKRTLPNGTPCAGGTCQAGACTPPGTCAGLGVACTGDEVCCSAQCGATGSQHTCRREDCRNSGVTCTPLVPGQCCDGACGCVTYGSNPPTCVCRSATCAATGATCDLNSECCVGRCGQTNGLGQCRSEACKLIGQSCGAFDCCDGACGCLGSTCTCRSETCVGPGVTCLSDWGCCQGRCAGDPPFAECVNT